jgi:phosphoribosylformimino-5-aminoimidazole carboxamide ribotide isomerase
MLGLGNETEARSALAAFPGGLHIGGGVNAQNARGWLEAGASHVIVTSWVFREGRVDWARLEEIVKAVGKSRLVLDLSCRKRGERRAASDGNSRHPSPVTRYPSDYFVVTDRWQKFTELAITPETLEKLAGSCAEFLIHAVDMEGLCRGIDRDLVGTLGLWTPIPVTYAGGANSLADLEDVSKLGQGKVDLTIGSALDIFGGSGVKYTDCVKFNRRLPGEA